MRAWYRARRQVTRVGTVLATLHFCILTCLLGGIAISPGRDWPWWPLLPYFLDWPCSILLKSLVGWTRDIMIALPHSSLAAWLLSQREPFSSLDLFWLPAIIFTVGGTLWHYYWPQAGSFVCRVFRPGPPPPPADRN